MTHEEYRERGIADGRACVADIEARGMTEMLLAGRSDVAFSETLVQTLARSVEALGQRATSEAAERYAEGFLQGADEAVTALRARISGLSEAQP